MRKSVINRNAFFLLLTCYYLVVSSNQSTAAYPRQGLDHGQIAPAHIQASKDYFDGHLKQNGQYSVEKVQNFVTHIYNMGEHIKSDVYETELLENLELQLRKYPKAHENAKEKALEAKGGILKGFRLYLIPKLEKIKTLVESKAEEANIDAAVDDFARGFVSYYMPNAHRSMWPEDVDVTNLAKKTLSDYKIKEHDPNKIEAFNLTVPASESKAVASCLRQEISNKYLTPQQLKTLANCGYDLSKLNPGISALWSKDSKNTKIKTKYHEEYFPKADEKIIFTKINYRSRSSPKIKAKFFRNGKRYRLKVKMGHEVATDLAVSRLMTLIGLNQDIMVHRKRVRVYLGEVSYEEFKSLYSNKYRIQSFTRYIVAHGHDGSQDWVDIDDAILEARPDHEIRVSPFDFSSWDLANRREYRSLLLLFAWLGMNDMQPGNCKLLFRKTSKSGSDYIPLHRIHDPGASLGAPLRFKKPNDLNTIGQYYKVNAFPATFIKADSKGTIHISWNDFANRGRNFQTSTWFDLKWMARQIASLSVDQIKQSLAIPKIPKPVAEIYLIKLLKRRNEIIKSFRLESQFPPQPLPKLDSINKKSQEGEYIIKKGVVKKTSFEGKNDPVQVARNWWTTIPDLMNFKIPVSEWNGSAGTELNNNLAGLRGLQTDLNLADYGKDVAVTSFPIGVGIQAVFKRIVSPNIHTLNHDGKMHLYKITDSITLKVGFDSPMLREVLKRLPAIDGDFTLRFYEKQFELIHYEDDAKKAYTSKFALLSAIKNPAHFAAYHLKPLASYRSFDKYGIDTSIGIGLSSAKPAIKNEISFLGGHVKNISNYYIRDQFGQLHVYGDKVAKNFAGGYLDLASINLFALQLPFLGLKFGHSHFNYAMANYILSVEHANRRSTDWNNKSRKKSEYQALIALENEAHSELLPDFVKLAAQVEAVSKHKTRRAGALYLFNNEKAKREGETIIKLANGKNKSFYHYGTVKNRYTGVDSPSESVPFFDLAMKNRKRIKTNLEMDLDKAERSVIVVRVEDFFRIQEQLPLTKLIDDLNRRYSKDHEHNFFRDYVLPPVEEVEEFPKVYALTRIFVNTPEFLEALKVNQLTSLEDQLYVHFTGHSKHQLRNKAPILKLKLRYKVQQALRQIKKIRDVADKQNRASRKQLNYHLAKFIGKLKLDTYGIRFLKDLLNEKSLFVTGEIAGLLRSFSALNDLQQLQRRRFMAHSWGEYKVKPPIQDFLRHHRIIPPTAFIQKGLSDSAILGVLETGIAPNLDTLYNHNNQF